MHLTEKPEIINFPATHYVYVEKIGPFQETAQKAWETLHQKTSALSEVTTITGYFSLYKIEPQMIYRAGVAVDSNPSLLPQGLHHVRFEGGKYAKFTLTGSYSNLPVAVGKVFEIVEKTGMQVRDAWYGENYVNDPSTTPEDQLITEILIPMI